MTIDNSDPERAIWVFCATLVPYIGEVNDSGEVVSLPMIVRLAHQLYGAHAEPLCWIEIPVH